MKRLVCVVEGHGEVAAVPNLCSRILLYLDIHSWVVDQTPIRQQRSRLVDEGMASPNRLCNEDHLLAAVELAMRRPVPADAVLILCDSDDDCAGVWGPHCAELVSGRVTGAGVMAVREYESWLLTQFAEDERKKHRVGDPERLRDAKGAMRRIVGDYSPSVDQLTYTRAVDIDAARALPSFDKLVRTIEALCVG